LATFLQIWQLFKKLGYFFKLLVTLHDKTCTMAPI
jgi:hypothetical protein